MAHCCIKLFSLGEKTRAQGENFEYCTASSVLPFLANFFRILEFDPDDVIYFSQFKTTLAEDLKVRCKTNLNMNLLAKASFFDKRFSKLTFLDKLEYNEGEELSKEEMIDISRQK